jgi:hypothetical protein
MFWGRMESVAALLATLCGGVYYPDFGGYLAPQCVLEVAFRDASRYRFFAVPARCVVQPPAADSKGR